MSANIDPRVMAAARLPLGGEFTMNGVTYRKVRLTPGRGAGPTTSCTRCPFYQGAHPDPCDRLYEAMRVRPCSDPAAPLDSTRMYIANVDDIPYLLLKGYLA